MKSIAFRFIMLAFGFGLFLPLKASDLDFAVDVFSFRDSKGTPYLEIHTSIDASTILYKKLGQGKFQGEVEVLLFLQEVGVEAEANALRVDLKSPVLADTSAKSLGQLLVDVRKLPAEEGKYILTGFVKDKSDNSEKEYSFEREVLVNPMDDNGLGFSDVLFLDNFKRSQEKKPYTRYGFDALSRISENYFENKDSLTFYLEMYNIPGMEAGDPYFLHTYITQANSSEKLSKYQRTVKKKAANLDLYSTSFDISELPSQTYFLNFELYSKENKLIGSTSRKFFVVNDRLSQDYTANPAEYDRYFGLSEQELDGLIPTLAYISSVTEADFAKSIKTFDEKKNYFLSFWEKRRENELDNPAKPWLEYKARIDYANEHYEAFRVPGWKTPRGRVLLTYGAPNDIEYHPTDNYKYPYEIWRYNRLRIQNNVLFVFWDYDRTTGDYQLLHSSLRGEINNPRWKLDLVRRSNNDGNLDNVDEDGNNDNRFGNSPILDQAPNP